MYAVFSPIGILLQLFLLRITLVKLSLALMNQLFEQPSTLPLVIWKTNISLCQTVKWFHRVRCERVFSKIAYYYQSQRLRHSVCIFSEDLPGYVWDSFERTPSMSTYIVAMITCDFVSVERYTTINGIEQQTGSNEVNATSVQLKVNLRRFKTFKCMCKNWWIYVNFCTDIPPRVYARLQTTNWWWSCAFIGSKRHLNWLRDVNSKRFHRRFQNFWTLSSEETLYNRSPSFLLLRYGKLGNDDVQVSSVAFSSICHTVTWGLPSPRNNRSWNDTPDIWKSCGTRLVVECLAEGKLFYFLRNVGLAYSIFSATVPRTVQIVSLVFSREWDETASHEFRRRPRHSPTLQSS